MKDDRTAAVLELIAAADELMDELAQSRTPYECGHDDSRLYAAVNRVRALPVEGHAPTTPDANLEVLREGA